ncbi:hypothetical protein BU17DRAFT_38569 [Hysterangium stoloniferum]|nr:hypothetical protein BU17DRAFT_38569 [Hysterangium stoloniferum]
MTVLGSVFLGDAHHRRVFTSTPPTSPSADRSSVARAQQEQVDREMEALSETTSASSEIEPVSQMSISPTVSLELRVKWLEALLLGVRQDLAKDTRNRVTEGKGAREETHKQMSLFRRAEDAQRKLDAVVAGNEGLKRFMDHYDQYAQYLTPSFALSGLASATTTAPSYSSMSSTELDALLSEMETDIRAADRDLRDIDALEKRGVTSAGKLADHEPLQPRLYALVAAHQEDLAKATELENRIGTLLETHATKVDALSELFVAWNDVITEAEDRVDKAEREKEEQRRLGFE